MAFKVIMVVNEDFLLRAERGFHVFRLCMSFVVTSVFVVRLRRSSSLCSITLIFAFTESYSDPTYT